MKLIWLSLVFLILIFPIEVKGIEKFPIEIGLEIERDSGFLKIYTNCYNFSSEKRELKMVVKIEKMGKKGRSSVLQSTKVVILPQARVKPMIAFLGVQSKDFYIIEVQFFDERGRLVFYKILTSEGHS